MTTLEVVKILQSQGHDVEFYTRKDGGILIRKIDGERYSGAKGNKRAREMTGAQISEARISQLKYATRARKVKVTLDDEIEREFQRVKKKWNKTFKSKNGKPHPAGYFGRARINYLLKKYSKKEVLSRILEAERYASGIAYSKNVQILATQIKNVANQYQSQELSKLADDIIENAYTIREEWIQPAYDELYKLNAGVSPKEVAKNTRAILRL